MRKLPNPSDSESSDHPVNDKQPTIQPRKRHRATNAADTDMHCTNTASRTDTADGQSPLIQSMGNTGSQSHNVCTPVDLDTCGSPELLSQSADATAVEPESVTMGSDTRPLPRPEQRRWLPSRYLDNIRTSASLIGQPELPRNLLSRVQGCLAETRDRRGCLTSVCVIQRVVAVKKSTPQVEFCVDSVCKVAKMPFKHCTLPDVEPSDSESSNSNSDGGEVSKPVSRPAGSPVE